MAVAYGTSVSSNSASSLAMTITGSDTALFVALLRTGTITVPTCTYDGVSMTLLSSLSETNGGYSVGSIYYLANPTTGVSRNIVPSDTCGIAAMSFSGVNQYGLLGAGVSNLGYQPGAKSWSASVTTLYPGCLSVGFSIGHDMANLSAFGGTGKTNRVNTANFGIYGFTGDAIMESPGADPMTASWSTNIGHFTFLTAMLPVGPRITNLSTIIT